MYRHWILLVMSAGALINTGRVAAQDNRLDEARIGGVVAPADAATATRRSKFEQYPSSGRAPGRIRGGVPELLPDQFPVSHLVRRTMIISGMLMLATATSLWLGYRRRSRTSSSDGEQTRVQILHTLNVAPRCFLHLIQVEEQRFLAARDPTGWKSITPVQSFAAQLEMEVQSAGGSADSRQPIELPPDPFAPRSERWQEYKWTR